MKKLFFVATLFVVVCFVLASCAKRRADSRSNIDKLIERVQNLETAVGELNTALANAGLVGIVHLYFMPANTKSAEIHTLMAKLVKEVKEDIERLARVTTKTEKEEALGDATGNTIIFESYPAQYDLKGLTGLGELVRFIENMTCKYMGDGIDWTIMGDIKDDTQNPVSYECTTGEKLAIPYRFDDDFEKIIERLIPVQDAVKKVIHFIKEVKGLIAQVRRELGTLGIDKMNSRRCRVF